MLKTRPLALAVVFIVTSPLLMTRAEAQQLPWFDAPVLSGPAGQFTCVTAPHPLYGVAITCDPMKLSQLPLGAQAFLLNHEHGHVAQMQLNKTFFVPNPEADADCYAAKFLRSNPAQFAEAMQWLNNVLGPNGGGLLHGNGFQVAAFATQCANTP